MRIVGVTNAIYLIDGLDGLSTGISIISCLSLLIIFALNDSPLISIILNGTYGLAMLILPVSITLIAGLKYMDVSYKEWLKTSWKLVLELLAVIIVIIAVVVFI